MTQTPMPSVQALLNRIFSGRQYCQTRRGVDVAEMPGRSSRWLVARSQCAFSLLDLSNIAAGKRQAALANQVELISPYAEPGFWAHWYDGLAAIWVWDGKAQREAMREHLRSGDKADVIDVYPESAFAAERQAGVCLLQSVDGYVAQHWRDGRLAGEIYWPALPDNGQWDRFARSVGERGPAPAADGSLAAMPLPWRQGRYFDINLRLVEPRAVLTLTAVLLLLLGIQLGVLARAGMGNFLTADDLSEARELKRPAVELRSRAFLAREQNSRLGRLERDWQLAAMAQLLDALSSMQSPGQIKQWSFNDGRLELVIASPASDLESYAGALDAMAAFSAVNLTPLEKSGELKIEAVVSERDE